MVLNKICGNEYTFSIVPGSKRQKLSIIKLNCICERSKADRVLRVLKEGCSPKGR